MTHSAGGTTPAPATFAVSRRAILAGACAAAALAAGCAGRGGSADGTGGASQALLGSTPDIPVGGGKVFSAQEVVVTQPTAGTFRAFSAICTHQGCQVTEVLDGRINCPCHGSQFAIADGAVVRGPARDPLPSREVTVEGTSLKLAG